MSRSKMARCCPCNGEKARCIRCVYVKENRLYFSCRPGDGGRCRNCDGTGLRDSVTVAPLPFDSPAVACSALLPTRCLSSDDDTIGAPVSSALLCSSVSDPHCCTAVPANRRDPSNTAGEDLGGHYLATEEIDNMVHTCLLYTSPSPRDGLLSRMPSSA